ncbi:MAG: hypothetical protein ACR2OR_16475, partial [Hyphomicrobiales bacterium]
AATGPQNMTKAEKDQFVQDFMDANYMAIEDKNSEDPNKKKADFRIGQISMLEVETNDDEVKINAQALVQARILGIIGVNNITVGATTEVIRELSGLELVMVLDNTTSMSGQKIIDLRVAAKDLVGIVFGDEDTPELLRIGLVPYSAAVNIGTDSINNGWIDADASAPIAQAKFNYDPDQTVWDLYDQIPNRCWNGCVEARLDPYDT